MTRSVNITLIVLLFSLPALPVWSQQYYLYEPRPIASEEKGQSKDGFLATEMSVQKGDTLYDISRKVSGHGMYYPQILLLNNIKNPNLIYPGSTLKIPVPSGNAQAESAHTKVSAVKSRNGKKKRTRSKAAVPVAGRHPVPHVSTSSATEISLRDLNARNGGKAKRHSDKVQSVSQGKARNNDERTAVVGKVEAEQNPADVSVAGSKLFERAVKAYKQDDFRTALELFDRYLIDNSGSPLAADVSLYKAECYLKLASQ
ncbi:MAG: LysM peptidoglycan-binding domain-containing protein [Desulfuromonadales bacterium]